MIKNFLLKYKYFNPQYYIFNQTKVKFIYTPAWFHVFNKIDNKNNFFFLTPLNNNLNIYNFKSIIDLNHDSVSLFAYNKNSSNTPRLQEYNTSDYSFINNFSFLKNSSFINFFINNLIDVPICFKKSRSLKNKNFELPILKFSNFLMKKGKRNQTLKILFNTLRSFFNLFKTFKLKINENCLKWINFYLITNNLFLTNFFKTQNCFKFDFKELIPMSYSNNFNFEDKSVNSSLFLKNFLYSLISKVSPIFSYFIYSVDKNIRKYSRGKSGKYVFIWKYIAPFKRIKLSIRWIVKDIKFYQSHTFNQRLFKTLENLFNAPEKSFASKSKIFSHNYVFKNFRKSLMTSLKTTS